MSDGKPDTKDGESFFRKVVRFVANPATDWAELSTPADEPRESGYAKSELKAMIERKRRNDFVRKREFDVLRKIRREGLPPDGLAALAGVSNLDDSEPRAAEMTRPDATVKAKIDEIEQQMEGESIIARRTAPARPPEFYAASTEHSSLDTSAAPMDMPFGDSPPTQRDAHVTTLAAPLMHASGPATVPGTLGAAVPAPAPVARPAAVPVNASFANPFAVEVTEIAHDPELDEAVISFANADFEACEASITALIAPSGSRHQHAETWLVLFDLYRAIGQQLKFESLALDYAQQFGWSAPQWFSIPQLVAADPPAQPAVTGPSAVRIEAQVGWVAPDLLDIDGVQRLRAQSLQMPMPWVLDWSAIRSIDPEACSQLSQLFRNWATQKLEMRWIGSDHLLDRLADAAPTGVHDADPVYWLLRLDALRLANRPDQFDEVAIDYCVTYEVSPPSWEPAKCTVKLSDSSGVTLNSRSMVTDVSTGFVESQVLEESSSGVRTAAVELSGQMVGDIDRVLKAMEAQLGSSVIVNVNCGRLIRVDFIAAGDLLNWVLARRSENRVVNFDDAHRLLALFFGAMGINEHARVKVRNI